MNVSTQFLFDNFIFIMLLMLLNVELSRINTYFFKKILCRFFYVDIIYTNLYVRFKIDGGTIISEGRG